jgi:hypothetical protein
MDSRGGVTISIADLNLKKEGSAPGRSGEL